MSLPRVYEQCKKFREGQSDLSDAPRPGQAYRVVTNESIAMSRRRHDSRVPSPHHSRYCSRITDEDWVCPPPPPYSPDLAPSDYHIFGALKDSLGGRKFASDEEVKEAVHEWLHTRPKNIFLAEIQAFPKRWATCITRVGDYVEK